MAPPRLKRRYIAFQVISMGRPKKQNILDAVQSSVTTLQEGPPLNQLNLRLIEYSPQTGRGILRCPHRAVNILRESLKNITKIADAPATIRVLGVSGTIKRLRRKFLK